MESAYPSIGTLFDPLKGTIQRYLAATTAAINDDYQYIDALAAETDPLEQLKSSGPDYWELTKKFLMMSVQMAANIVDPTWKTQWFMPGPLTPIGIIAKTLATNWSDDDGNATKDLTAGEDPCAPPTYAALIEGGLSDFYEQTATSYGMPGTPPDPPEAAMAPGQPLYDGTDLAAFEEIWNKSESKWTIHMWPKGIGMPGSAGFLDENSHKSLHGEDLKINFYSPIICAPHPEYEDVLGCNEDTFAYSATFDEDVLMKDSTPTIIGVRDIGWSPGGLSLGQIAGNISYAIGRSLKKFHDKTIAHAHHTDLTSFATITHSGQSMNSKATHTLEVTIEGMGVGAPYGSWIQKWGSFAPSVAGAPKSQTQNTTYVQVGYECIAGLCYEEL
jgi:hypothetical protein